jgi:hypothetical protein
MICLAIMLSADMGDRELKRLTSFGLAHNASFASQGQESSAVRMPVNKMCKLCEKAEQVFPNVYLENSLQGGRFKRRNVGNALKSGAVGS